MDYPLVDIAAGLQINMCASNITMIIFRIRETNNILQYPVHIKSKKYHIYVEMKFFNKISKDWKIMELGEFTKLLIP